MHMINFDNIKLTKKFYSIFVGILSLLLIVTITLTVRSSFAVNSSERVVHEVIPAIQSICDVQADFKDTRIYAIKLPTATDEAREQLIKDYKETISHILQHVEGFRGMIKDNYVNEMKTVVQAYNDITLNDLEKAIEAGDLMRANEVIKIQLVPLGKRFDEVSIKINDELAQDTKIASDELTSDVDPTINNILLVIVIFLALVSLRGLSKSIVNRINQVSKCADALASGDLTQKIPYLGGDEIGQLGRDINKVIENLNAIVKDMKDDSKTLNHATDDVNEITNVINDKSNNVLDRVITISSAAEEMVATSLEVASNCSLAAGSSEEAKNVAVEGMNVVVNTVDEIKNHAVKTREDANLILELGNKTQQINSIISTIQDIASQTNLLALNAAIEAARAGEYGKGFAVVADEVRALAVRSADATKEINTMITSVIEDVQKSNDSIIDTVNKMDAIAQNAGQLQNTLDVITQKVGDVNTQITQIAAATEQQTGTSKEMSTHLQEIKGRTQEATDSATSARQIMDKFIEISHDMNETVNKFKV